MVEKVGVNVTFLMPPGKSPDGILNSTAAIRSFPAKPEEGSWMP